MSITYPLPAPLAVDAYKTGHADQYHPGTTLVYSNFTARSGKHSNVAGMTDGVVFFGLRYVIEYVLRSWCDFIKLLMIDRTDFRELMDPAMGPGVVTYDRLWALRKLGYVPIKIRALPEGTVVPYGVPMLTIENTHPEFFWLTNYLETALSAELWKLCTSATTAHAYRMLFDRYAQLTNSAAAGFCEYQGHDFSARGMSGVMDAASSGAAHLLSFKGTDTLFAIPWLWQYYDAPKGEHIGGSVPATEHSVMCVGSAIMGERELFKDLITRVYPTGIVSIVSDTWDLWTVLGEYLPSMRDVVMARDGKLVIRPDSGDPVKIVCGDPDASDPRARRGALGLLWDTFGGTVSAEGYKVLDPHVGLIYGDSITPAIAQAMLAEMKRAGFASTNIVLGIGSFTYQCVTRDTHGFAIKTTYCEVDGKPYDVFKAPKTDAGGMKKSLRGLIAVRLVDGQLRAFDGQSKGDLEMVGNLLQVVWENGRWTMDPPTYRVIRQRLEAHRTPRREMPV